MAKTTLKNLVLAAIASSKKGSMVNSEIRLFIEKRKPDANAASIDTVLSKASAEGLLNRKKSSDGKSKFEYSLSKEAERQARRLGLISIYSKEVKERIPRGQLPETVLEALGNSYRDSNEVFRFVQAKFPFVKKSSVDNALFVMSKAGRIIKSKNPMTDVNVSSNASRSVYGKKTTTARTLSDADIRSGVRSIVSTLSGMDYSAISSSSTFASMALSQSSLNAMETQIEAMFKVTPDLPLTGSTTINDVVSLIRKLAK